MTDTSKTLGRDAEITTNEKGGKQSKTVGAFHMLDAKAMMRLGGILQYGADRYSANNWRLIPMESHLNHALQHIFAFMLGDKSDDHLGHAFCRLMFAIAVERELDFTGETLAKGADPIVPNPKAPETLPEYVTQMALKEIAKIDAIEEWSDEKKHLYKQKWMRILNDAAEVLNKMKVGQKADFDVATEFAKLVERANLTKAAMVADLRMRRRR